jgi:hypothetical protein
MMWIVGLILLALLAFAIWGSGRAKPARHRQRGEPGTTLSAEQPGLPGLPRFGALLQSDYNRNQANSDGTWG